MNAWILHALILACLAIRPSHQDCKVMAECEDDLRWKLWPTDGITNGRPGKTGAPGPTGIQGQKGEPGETLIEQPEEDSSPTREFLSHTITWDSAKAYCLGIGRRLCRENEICIHENGGRRMIDEVLLGDHWTPTLDGHNYWLQIGDSRRFTCYRHGEVDGGRYGLPTWGGKVTPYSHKSYVYCCGRKFAPSEPRYRYIGKTTTYDSARAHCSSLGRRLCRSSEVCQNNVPIYGAIARDSWVPVSDRYNEWIQIATSRTCHLHRVRYGAGTRTDGSERSYIGFVLCC